MWGSPKANPVLVMMKLADEAPSRGTYTPGEGKTVATTLSADPPIRLSGMGVTVKEASV